MAKSTDWMYGHPRGRAQSTGCKHLQVASFAQHREIETEEASGLVEASAAGLVNLKTIKVLQQPSVAFLCNSPKVNAQLSANIPVPELREQWKTTAIPLELCSICPCWEKR